MTPYYPSGYAASVRRPATRSQPDGPANSPRRGWPARKVRDRDPEAREPQALSSGQPAGHANPEGVASPSESASPPPETFHPAQVMPATHLLAFAIINDTRQLPTEAELAAQAEWDGEDPYTHVNRTLSRLGVISERAW